MSSSQTKLSASALARRREIARVWNLLHPKPMELRKGRRRFLREGHIKQWSPVQKRVKKKYVFLFSDCLLITRKDNSHTYWMKIFCFLSSIKDIQFVPGQAYGKVPDVEFRVVTAKKTLIFFGASKSETDTWIRDLNYARNGCKGRAPPSVMQYGDEDNELDGQEDEIDITHEPFPTDIRSGGGSFQPTSSSTSSSSTSPPPTQKNDDLILIDFSGANSAFNPFGTGAPTTTYTQPTGFEVGSAFDPFGLQNASVVGAGGPSSGTSLSSPGQTHQQQQAGYGGGPGATSGTFDPTFLFGMGQAPNGGESFSYGTSGASSSQTAQVLPPQPAPVFLPDAAKGAAQVASDLVRYLEQMPPGLRNSSINSSTQRAKEASEKLQAAIQAFTMNPNPETGRLLQQAAAEAALIVSQLMGEATLVAESQPPDDYKRQLAAAVHLTALSLEQLVNASSLALDHYTQHEHQRAMQAQAQAQAQAIAQAQAFQAEAEARARAEEEQRQAMLALQVQQAALAQQKAQMEEAEHARLLAIQQEQEKAIAAEQARLKAAQEAQQAQEALISQQEAQAFLSAMAAVPAAMESVALSIAAAGEKLAAAAAAAAEKAAAENSAVPVASGEIVQGTSSIVSLTAALIRVATEAQAEVSRRIGAALANKTRYHDDPVWREGLISAAQDVGTNIELLVAAATDATEHNGPLEMLIAALRQVNGATARLVTAARAKMNPDSEVLPRLGSAASAVKQASSNLEQTAAAASKQRESASSSSSTPEDTLERTPTATAAYIQRMEKLAEVARLEKQLEEARKRVAQITKAQYETH